MARSYTQTLPLVNSEPIDPAGQGPISGDIVLLVDWRVRSGHLSLGGMQY